MENLDEISTSTIKTEFKNKNSSKHNLGCNNLRSVEETILIDSNVGDINEIDFNKNSRIIEVYYCGNSNKLCPSMNKENPLNKEYSNCPRSYN